ncbi:CAP domain-containing protein [Sporosarcina limicola]|uniref:YkwD family protein n=1 Tax=Sporosarcina limicola TaxID=34101 RepID=A0A927MKR2_9BACL|nr:CAP domain-containing protein [Sporosarcina limicola]MBE1554742.1 putative YkwD family protein [Sporosarcina limicola]
MKKSIAVILLGSALLLPNNNSAEASYSNKEVQVQKAQYTNCVVLGGQQFNFSNSQKYSKSYWNNVKKAYGKETVQAAPTKPAEQPKPSVPVTKAKAKPVAPVVTTPTQPTAPVAPQPKPTTPVATAPTQDASVSAIEKAVLDLTNVERQKAGLAPLQTDSKLMNSARQKSADMASKNYFSHTSPTYGSPFDQMKTNGITYRSAAENIAMGQRTAEEVVKGWMESPGHRQNILEASYTHIGIGYDKAGNYWTQQFIQK